jgi:hypothetical protein
MSDSEGTAAARPEDHVREFMKQLEHPETVLKTDTRRDGSDVWGGTSWGHAGRDAILARLQRAERLEAVLTGIVDHWWEFGDMIVFNNVENKDDYGFSERIDIAAKLVKPT